MKTSISGSESDGTIKVEGILNERQIEALTKLDIEALEKITHNEMLTDPPETWVDYWFDKNKISDDEIRSEINCAINTCK